ncbi:MAG TPA: hypothetical protein VIU39_12840, partial [Anaerolineales bacterium]
MGDGMQGGYYLGVDAGGTKTHALVADDRGRAAGFATGGPGNWQSVGFDGQRQVLRKVVDPESIRLLPQGRGVLWTSEGDLRASQSP